MTITLKVPANRNDHFIGSLDAPIILVEYGDLECPNTKNALKDTDKLMTEFRDQLCFVFRHFPVTDIHLNSAMASLACEAAHHQGKFWKMFRHLLSTQDSLSGPYIVDAAMEIGIVVSQFLKDMENDELMIKIQDDINSGEESGVVRTPGFYLNGILLDFPTNYDLLRKEILDILQENELSV